jgi:hypothetical protein
MAVVKRLCLPFPRKEREKIFLGPLSGRKRAGIFSAKDVVKNVRERAKPGKKSKKG